MAQPHFYFLQLKDSLGFWFFILALTISLIFSLSDNPDRDSFRIGRLVLEKWGVNALSNLPADVLIHLAYYRRWSKDTDGALRVTKCLEGRDFNTHITAKERAILATERAAAFLDLHEKQGGSLQDALRFLKYSYAANGGASTVENAMCWKRYEKLVTAANI